MQPNKHAVSLLRSLQFIERQSNISRNDLLKILLDVRQLIESERIKSKLPLINLFLNWCFHPNITESSIAYKQLVNLSVSFLNAVKPADSNKTDKDTTAAFTQLAQNVLNIPLLRQEFIQLFKQYHLPKYLFTIKHNWESLVKVILEEINDKPLTFPDTVLNALPKDALPKKYTEAYKALNTIRCLDVSKPWAHIVEIRIVNNAEGFKNMYAIQLHTEANVHIMVQLLGSEPESEYR